MLTIGPLWVRLLGAGICLVLLTFFVNPLLLGIRHAGCFAGMAACVLGMVFFLANPWISAALGTIWQNDTGRIFLCIVYGFLAVCVLLAAGISIAMGVKTAKAPTEEQPVVILGCKVRSDGPSLMLLHRLEAAEAYLKAHPDVPVIVCGGQGADEPMSEAQSMFDYLTEHGIEADRIRMEDQSASTYENLRNAKEILEEEEMGYKITVVTDGYHQLRASMIAKGLRMETCSVSAKTSWYLVPSYWVREWLGVCYQVAFGE